MNNETLIEKLKHLVYLMVKPVYLWSIGFKTIEEYVLAIEKEYMAALGHCPVNAETFLQSNKKEECPKKKF